MEGQKRTLEEADPSLLDGIMAVIVDIEGTTTPIDFVKESLFPYVRENLESYLNTKYDEEETQADICALREQAIKDKADNIEGTVEIPSDCSKEDIIKAVMNNVNWQMDCDRKTTELKQLQGHIWREAYKTGKVKAKMFDDVGRLFRELKEGDIFIYVYSSGSVEAQKLLFKHAEEGDLTEYLKGYFDTTIGPKTVKDSYVKILEKLAGNPEPQEVLFLTDMPQEAEAASQAGLKTALVAREGNEDLTEEHFQKFLVIESFDELFGEDDEDYKRFETEGNGEYNEDDEDDDEEDDVCEEDEEEPEDDEGEEDEDA